MRFAAVLLGAFVVSFTTSGCSQALQVKTCSAAGTMTVYSNASYIEETGDVVGYEIAIQKVGKNNLRAVFFVYEGTPNLDGIPLSGSVTGDEISLTGTWKDPVVQYPSNKKTVLTHPVHIEGTLAGGELRGTLRIDQDVAKVIFERADRPWLCKGGDH